MDVLRRPVTQVGSGEPGRVGGFRDVTFVRTW